MRTGGPNPDPLRILSLDRPTDSEADQQLNLAKSEQSGKVRNMRIPGNKTVEFPKIGELRRPASRHTLKNLT